MSDSAEKYHDEPGRCCGAKPDIRTVGSMSVVRCDICGGMSPAYRGDFTKGVPGTIAAWNRGERV